MALNLYFNLTACFFIKILNSVTFSRISVRLPVFTFAISWYFQYPNISDSVALINPLISTPPPIHKHCHLQRFVSYRSQSAWICRVLAVSHLIKTLYILVFVPVLKYFLPYTAQFWVIFHYHYLSTLQTYLHNIVLTFTMWFTYLQFTCSWLITFCARYKTNII